MKNEGINIVIAVYLEGSKFKVRKVRGGARRYPLMAMNV